VSFGTPVFSTNKTDHKYLTEMNSALQTFNVPKKLVLHVTAACSLNGAVEAACNQKTAYI
jgi:hypothetical protein